MEFDDAPQWLIDGRPPGNCATGDARAEPIFQAVGHAMHSWELLNATLDGAFAVASGSANPGTIAAITLIESTVQRLRMLDACLWHWASMHNRREVAERFSVLKGKILLVSGLRNFFAHGVVATLNGDWFECRRAPKAGQQHFVIHPFAAPGKGRHEFGVKRWYSSRAATECAIAADLLKLKMDHLVHGDLLDGEGPFDKMGISALKLDRQGQ